MMLGVFADAIVAILLVATISYAAVLNRRLGVLRGDRAKLEELVAGLTVASQRAEGGIASLKTTVADVGRQLEKKIELAQGLRDDLTYMIERGGTMADRLEGTLRARRDDKPEPRYAETRDPAPRPLETRHVETRDPGHRPVEPRQVDTRHLEPRDELRAEPRHDSRPAPRPEPRRDAIAQVTELRSRMAPKAERPAPEPETPAASRAERDLLRALSSLR
jgi:hypothetical protein